jgi:cytochrome c biogenesis protein CcmG/thiol:disulfide interchange protein DsbE
VTAPPPKAGPQQGTARMSRFLWPLGLFLVLAGFLFAGLYLNPREVPSPLIGKPVPDFRVAQLGAPDKTSRRPT